VQLAACPHAGVLPFPGLELVEACGVAGTRLGLRLLREWRLRELLLGILLLERRLLPLPRGSRGAEPIARRQTQHRCRQNHRSPCA
jgi:hypothetical protein